MIHSLEDKTKKELVEICKIHVEEYQQLTKQFNYVVDLYESRIENMETRIKELEQAQNQLLSLIYNTAVGNVAMGYPVDIESLASEAYEITGINAEKVKTQQPEVK